MSDDETPWYVPIRTVKVFDCQAMPVDVRKAFFWHHENTQVGNDVYVDWSVLNTVDPPAQTNLVDAWLVANNAVEFEDVIIKHWW